MTLILFEKLRALRKKTADGMNVPAFVVFGRCNAAPDGHPRAPSTATPSCESVALASPSSTQYGDDFIAVIRDHAAAHGVRPSFGAPPTPRPRTGGTHMQTLELVREGSNVAEIAAARGISQQTVLTHLERLMDEGESFDITHLLPPQHRYVRIAHALRTGDDGRLKPVADRLGGGYSYEELRLVRLHMRQFGDAR